MANWPFKHLSQKSEWPMHGLVVQFAAAVINAPPNQRMEAASKMVERCFRMGARLAHEFGLAPEELMQMAQKQIEREIPGAKVQLAEAASEKNAKLIETATSVELTEQVKAALASKKIGDSN